MSRVAELILICYEQHRFKGYGVLCFYESFDGPVPPAIAACYFFYGNA